MAASRDSGSGDSFWRKIIRSFTRYETSRTVEFNTPGVALCYRFSQIVIIAHIIGYILIVEKGYQKFENGDSSVVAKVKGNQLSSIGLTWDPADVVIPPLENNALFITTTAVFTPKQRHGVCAEAETHGVHCGSDEECHKGHTVKRGHGYMTGICNTTTSTCEVSAWCPLEDEKKSLVRLTGGEGLTILVKNFILFPHNNVKRRNIVDDLLPEYLQSCTYNPKTDPFCPIFVLGDIVALAGENFNDMARHGAILSFGITWDCNLDFALHHCIPQYSFRRLDDSSDTNFPGWNFRYTGYWYENGRPARALIKATGIRIIFSVYATAGKFDPVKSTLMLGSSLGLLGLATMLCDYILFNWASPAVLKRRRNAAVLEDKEIPETPQHNGKSSYDDYKPLPPKATFI